MMLAGVDKVALLRLLVNVVNTFSRIIN